MNVAAGIVAAVAFIVMAFTAAPSVVRKFGSDDFVIEFERTQRYLRHNLQLPLPDAPDLAQLRQRLSAKGLAVGQPVLVRIFKKEFELELWLQRGGRFERFATYPICVWSGDLGPKLREGDGQAPEGFYSVDAAALNPKSAYHRSFNVGYPNAFDAANGRTGSLIMVHGDCVSIGCFAMTNPQIDEIWQLVTAALTRGQKRFQVQIYPFRLTDAAMTAHAQSPDIAFWRDIKAGSDLFEASSVPPKVMACQGRYQFERGTPGYAGDAPAAAQCPAQ